MSVFAAIFLDDQRRNYPPYFFMLDIGVIYCDELLMAYLGVDDVFGTAPRGADVGVKLSNVKLDSLTVGTLNVTAGSTFRDSSTFIVDATNSTIRIGFNAAGTTGTTATLRTSQVANRIYTIPDSGANASFVTTEGAQIINGQKTIPTLLTDQITEATPSAGIRQIAAFLSFNDVTTMRNDGSVQTTDDTPGYTTNVIPTVTNTVTLFRADIIGSTSTGDVVIFKQTARVKNIADVLAVDSIAAETWSDADAPLAAATATVNFAGTNITVEVVGVIGQTINWRTVVTYTTVPL